MSFSIHINGASRFGGDEHESNSARVDLARLPQIFSLAIKSITKVGFKMP